MKKIKSILDRILSKHPKERSDRIKAIFILAGLSVVAICLVIYMASILLPSSQEEAAVTEPVPAQANIAVAVDTDKATTKEYSWTTHDGAHKATLDIEVFTDTYEFYRQSARPEHYLDYVTEQYNHEQIQNVAKEITSLCVSLRYQGFSVAREAVAFVQHFSHSQYDPEWTRFPTELLYEGYGDCKDTSLFLATLLKELGYKTALIVYDDHMAVGISSAEISGKKFRYEGTNYSYIETCVNGYDIGEIPEEYAERSARIIPLD